MKAPHLRFVHALGLLAVGILLLLSQGCAQKQTTQVPTLAAPTLQPPAETMAPPTATNPPQPARPTTTASLPTATKPLPTATEKPPTATVPSPTSTPADRTVPPQFLARLNYGEITNIALSPGGDWLAVLSSSHICLFDTVRYEQAWCKPTELPAEFEEGKLPNGTPYRIVLSLAFHPDGEQIAYSLWNGYIVFLDRSTGRRLKVMDAYFLNTIWYLAWSQDGERMVIQSKEHGIDIWDMVASEQAGHLDIAPDAVAGSALSPDSRILAVGLQDEGKIALWDMTTFKQISLLEIGSQGSAYNLAWSPDGKYLYSSLSAMVSDCGGQCTTQLGWVKAWDMVKGKLAFEIEVGEDVAARLAVSADGKWLAAGSGYWSVKVFDALTGVEVARQPRTYSHNGLAWLAGDRLVYPSCVEAAFQPQAQALSQLEPATNEQTFISLDGFDDVNNFAWLPDGERLVTDSMASTLSIWQARTGQRLKQFQFLIGNKPLTYSFSPASISPVDGQFATSIDGSIMTVDVETRQVLKTLEYENKTSETHIGTTSWSKDGKRLAGMVYSAGMGTVAVWDVETGKSLLTIPAERPWGIYAPALSPDGTRLALSARQQDKFLLVIWDIASKKQVVSIDMPCSIWELTWLAEDQIAFAGSSGIEIWDLTAAKQLRLLDAFSLLAISPDGRLAAMSEGMGVISIRDFSSGKKLAAFKAESITIRDAAFSPDSRLLATLTDAGSLIIWDMSQFYP